MPSISGITGVLRIVLDLMMSNAFSWSTMAMGGVGLYSFSRQLFCNENLTYRSVLAIYIYIIRLRLSVKVFWGVTTCFGFSWLLKGSKLLFLHYSLTTCLVIGRILHLNSAEVKR